jgi:DNA-binding FrmR family transcriptional regulator
LKRAKGQLAGVINAIEHGSNCRDVVTQLTAVSKAVDKAGFLILSTAMRECLAKAETTDGQSTNSLTMNELERLFLVIS